MTKNEAIKTCKEILDFEELSLEVVTISPEDEDSYLFKEGQKVFRILDNLEANLGNIEAERFDNLRGVMERLEIYHKDYLDPFEEGNGQPEMRAFLNDEHSMKLLWDVSPEDYLASGVA